MAWLMACSQYIFILIIYNFALENRLAIVKQLQYLRLLFSLLWVLR